MIAAEVIDRLKARGVTFKATSTGGLRVVGVDRLTDSEKATLRAHKASILKILGKTHPPPPAPVAGSTAVVEPSVRECRNCVHWQQYPFEPVLGSCYALQRMQNAGSKPARFGCSNFELKEVRS